MQSVSIRNTNNRPYLYKSIARNTAILFSFHTLKLYGYCIYKFIDIYRFTNPFFVYAFCMTRRKNNDYLCKQRDQLDFLMGTNSTFLAVTNNVLCIVYMEFVLKLLN